MLFLLSLLFVLFNISCTQKAVTPTTIKKAEWIQKSDTLAGEFSLAFSKLSPEFGSEVGYKEFDKLGYLFNDKNEELNRKFFAEWVTRIDTELEKATDEELRTDLRVMKTWLQNQIESIDSYKRVREISFFAAAKFVYQGLEIVLNAQASAERKKAGVDRFKVYVHGDATHLPLVEAMAKEFQDQLKEFKGKKPLLPFHGEVEQYLKDANSYLAGIEELLKSSGRTDWNADWGKFKSQMAVYNSFIKNEVLKKHTRKDSRVPREIYAQILKRRGIARTPEQLIETGLNDYKELYKKFRQHAEIVANKNGFKNTNPADVIRSLKANPVTTLKEVDDLYHKADQRLEKIMKENSLISVPTAPLRIRIAGDAESRAVPVPHLKPPPLIDNQGQRPEFVVPSSSQGMPFDDFSSPHSAIVLTAHEGRPGHDMQFSQMLDNGVSVIRSRYAVNNVNIEGWALYAEDLVYPYLTPEEQLFGIQTRLWRIVRMFLDPQIQLGLIKDERVIEVFTQELGVSKVMAGLELKRYKYEDIGQAPSYYEGYLIVSQMRAEAEKRLGAKFNLKCFNDRLLSFGLLPLSISSERMETVSHCP